MRFRFLSGLGFLLLFARFTAAAAGSLAGTVRTADGQPVSDAHVSIPDLQLHADSDADGRFRFPSVPAGAWLIEVSSRRAGRHVERVRVAAGLPTELEIRLDFAVHEEEVVVSAGGAARTAAEVAQPVTVLAGQDLAVQMKPTLGELLAGESGVSQTSFGPGASRPVIRGLGGDRIRVLENGLGVGDASGASPDHAVASEPMTAESVEVIRGPATLLYGSSAVGGVVNVIDDSIPDHRPDSPVSATVELLADTVADERSGALELTGGVGAVAFNVHGSKRKTGDYAIPGYPRRRPEAGEENPKGFVPNSALESDSLSGGVAILGDAGYFGVSGGTFSSLYGSPAEEEVVIDLHRQRLDFRGELKSPLPFLRKLKVSAGRVDYEHTEFEGAEVGTRFRSESREGRLEATQAPLGALTGTIGLQTTDVDFEAIGEEAFIVPTRTRTNAFFAVEEIGSGKLRLQLGGRYEKRKIDVEDPDDPSRTGRSRSGASGSLAVLWLPGDDWSASLSLARSTKIPNAEELFAYGPHVATGAFEIGNPDLDTEKSLGIDLLLRKRTGRLTGEISAFHNRFDGFIYEERTGEVEDGLEVVRFVQNDAEFLGAEASAHLELLHSDPHHLEIDVSADHVRAELTGTGEPLPQIPPTRFGIGLRYQGSGFSGAVELRLTAKQNRTAGFESSTAGFTMLNAHLAYRAFLGLTVTDLILRGTNLTDREARNHISFTKDRAPLPGRNVSLALRFGF